MSSPVLKVAGGLTALYVAAALVMPVAAYYNATQTDWVPELNEGPLKTCVNDRLKDETREFARLSAERAFFEATTLGLYEDDQKASFHEIMPVKINLNKIICLARN